MLTFIGLDLSLTATGVGIIDGDYGHGYAIRPPAGLRGVARLEFIEKRVLEEIGIHKNIAGIAIEGYAMRAQSRQFALGELGGVIRLAVYRRRLPCVIVPPQSLKMYVTGKGGTSKDDVLKAVNDLMGFGIGQGDRSKPGDRISDDNVADGLALAHVARMRFGTGPEFTGVPVRFVKKLRELELLPTHRVRSRG